MRLAGVLSRGSERSRALARQASVAHYAGLEALPQGVVDAAVVAVPGEAGTRLAVGLLDRGIPVLAEHPWEPEALERALAAAAERGVAFEVNGHFADLAEGAGTLLRHAAAAPPPLYAHLTANPRTLWSALDLLGRALGALRPLDLAPAAARGPGAVGFAVGFAVLQGTLAGVATTILCQTQVSAEDDGSATLVNHRLELGDAGGLLSMADTFGPVVRVERSLPPALWSRPAWSLLSPLPTAVAGVTVTALRHAANLAALGRFAAHLRGAPPAPEVAPAYLRDLAAAWRAVLDRIGDLGVVGGL
jgi:thiazolinyl imide reductase